MSDTPGKPGRFAYREKPNWAKDNINNSIRNFEHGYSVSILTWHVLQNITYIYSETVLFA